MNKPVTVKTEARLVDVNRPVSRKTVPASARKANSLSRLSWSLPSGESLAEFALRLGFLAPPLFGRKSSPRQTEVR
jgi:hypothetical protein